MRWLPGVGSNRRNIVLQECIGPAGATVEIKGMERMKTIQFVLFVIAIVGGVFLSGCVSGNSAACDAANADSRAAKPLTKFDGMDYIAIYDTVPLK